MAKKFHYGSKASKEAAEKATRRGGKVDKFKMETDKAKLLILGATDPKVPAVFTTVIHELTLFKKKNGKMEVKNLGRCASPAFDGETDQLMQLGFKLKEKYKDSKNEKKKNFWKECMPERKHHVNVLNLSNPDDGAKTYTMPNAVAEVVLDEFKDCGDDVGSICDFDEGRPLMVKVKAGKRGHKSVRYGAKFLAKQAGLIERGLIDDETIEELAEGVIDLTRLQPKFNEEEFEKYFEMIAKRAEKIGIDLEEVGIDAEDDDEIEEEEVDESEMEDDDDDEDGEESDDDDDEDGDDEESDDDDDDEDGDESDDDDDDDEEFDADLDTDDDDDDELQLDADDLEDDEEEEEKPKKSKKSTKSKSSKSKTTKKKEEKKKTTKSKTSKTSSKKGKKKVRRGSKK